MFCLLYLETWVVMFLINSSRNSQIYNQVFVCDSASAGTMVLLYKVETFIDYKYIISPVKEIKSCIVVGYIYCM